MWDARRTPGQGAEERRKTRSSMGRTLFDLEGTSSRSQSADDHEAERSGKSVECSPPQKERFGRRGTKQPATVVFAAGGTRSGLGKSQRDLGKKSDSANISVTNSFGSLLTDMEGTDLSADVVELEGNKENEEILIQSRNEKKVIHGNVVPMRVRV